VSLSTSLSQPSPNTRAAHPNEIEVDYQVRGPDFSASGGGASLFDGGGGRGGKGPGLREIASPHLTSRSRTAQRTADGRAGRARVHW
jgi:hypothetical protein